MREIRINVGMTPYINKIIKRTMFVNDASRSLIIRYAVKKRYEVDKLKFVDGPFESFARVYLPREGVAYVRELAHKNNVPMSAVYCAMIKKYICSD